MATVLVRSDQYAPLAVVWPTCMAAYYRRCFFKRSEATTEFNHVMSHESSKGCKLISKNWNSWNWLTFKPSFPGGHTAHRLLCLISIFPTLTVATALCCHGVGQFAEPRLMVWTLSWAYFWGTFHWKLESSHGKVWNNYPFTLVIWRRSSARVEIGRVESN